MTDRFPNTRRALVEYDKRRWLRDQQFQEAETDEDMYRWQADRESDINEVRFAFFEDTKGFNALHHCMIADIGFMRRCTLMPPKEDDDDSKQ